MWIWDSEGTQYYFDKNEPVYFRVESEEWNDQSPSGPNVSDLGAGTVAVMDRTVPYCIQVSFSRKFFVTQPVSSSQPSLVERSCYASFFFFLVSIFRPFQNSPPSNPGLLFNNPYYFSTPPLLLSNKFSSILDRCGSSTERAGERASEGEKERTDDPPR